MLWQLFKTFFKAGIGAIGGGYVMIPLIEAEVVDRRGWLDREEYMNFVVVSQTCPGVFAINISTTIGYKLRHTSGALIAAIGTALPSFLIILTIALVWRNFQDVPLVQAAFRGIRPATVALIAVPTFSLARSAHLTLYTCWIPVFSALLIWLLGINPVIVLLCAAFLGYLFSSRLFS